MKKRIISSICSLFLLSAIEVTASDCCFVDNWSFNVGPSYVIPFAYNTRGDISHTADGAGVHMNVSGDNLRYKNAWGFNAALGADVAPAVNVSLNYEYFNSQLWTRSPITGALGGFTTSNSYDADLFMNTFLVKGRYTLPFSTCISGAATDFFVAGGIGASNLYLSHQRLDQYSNDLSGGTQGSLAYSLNNNNVWRFAYSAEVGATTTLTECCKLDYGVRYTNYGRYSSGTDIIESFPLKSSVTAHMNSIAPFVSLVVNF